MCYRPYLLQQEEDYIAKRRAINTGLRYDARTYFIYSCYVKRDWASIHEGTLFLDLEAKIPFVFKSEEGQGKEGEGMWDDALHFSAAGYDRFGELVYEVIVGSVASGAK